MGNIPINMLDLCVILLLGLGAVTGLILGFIRGGLFVISWLGSVVITFISFPYMRPYTRQYIERDFIADITSGLIIFIITLIFLFLLSSIIGGWVRNSRLNSLDRSLGMLAGIITSTILLSGSYILAGKIWPPEKQPLWMLEAKALPLIRKGAETLAKILPNNFEPEARKIFRTKTSKTRKLIEKEAYERFISPSNKKSNIQDRDGYDKKERIGIENLLEKTQ
jgi:membrane protein required for colicin V production